MKEIDFSILIWLCQPQIGIGGGGIIILPFLPLHVGDRNTDTEKLSERYESEFKIENI